MVEQITCQEYKLSNFGLNILIPLDDTGRSITTLSCGSSTNNKAFVE